VYHAHALEFDRSGENINRDVYAIEKLAMETADHVVAVSHYTRGLILSRYGIAPEKVSVVHNAVSRRRAGAVYHVRKEHGRRIVLFLGRVTFQKGPDYFVEAAARVLHSLPDVTFVMAGSGDMLPRMVDRVAQLRIGSAFHFTGFLGADDVERMYAMSDVYVMPSVSEPFGIAPLEAMLYDVPVIVSRQAGVAEVLKHALQVDFWDIDEMAGKIAALLRYPVLAREVVRNGRQELRSIRWAAAADAVLSIYERITR
jgi:glycosyltransferase involved in cell wall biosynthesis